MAALQDPLEIPPELDLGGYRFPVRPADHAVAGARLRVRKHAIRHVVVIEVAGRLGDIVEDLDWAIQMALASGPRAVACDLTAVLGDIKPDTLEVLATAGRHVRDWPGIPIAVASPDPQVREALSSYPLGDRLIVTKSMLSALYAVLRKPAPSIERLRLTPHPTAPGVARDFVTSTLLGWHLAAVVPSACLVTSELVTNSTLHAGSHSDINLSVAQNQRSVRVTVRDHSPDLPREQHPGLDLHGRGLTIVAGVSRAFGVLPTADGGKVVWALLDVPQPGPSTTPDSGDPPPAKATATTVSPGLPVPATLSAPAGRPVPTSLGQPRTTALHTGLGHVVAATRSTAVRHLTFGRVGPSLRSHPRPSHDSSSYLG